jgi:lactate dehydrogenase-like 2-hydroxyacid dehydrogenase
LNGRTLGIIGLGRIGTATALRAKAFSLNVIFYGRSPLFEFDTLDPFLEYGRAKALGIGQVDTLEELLQQSDIISVHCPLTHHGKNNQHLLNKDTLKHVKKGCVIINTARGPIIQEEALVEALKGESLRYTNNHL